MEEFFLLHRPVFVLVHLAGVAVGVGGATITDIFFFRFLRNLRISNDEARILRVLSGIIWVALVGVIISGLALYAADIDRYHDTPKFLAKMTVLLIILLNGLLLNMYISPRLSEIDFKRGTVLQLRKFRRIAFGSGALSLTSWYSSLILGGLRSLPFSFGEIIGVYACLAVGAITYSQVVEWSYAKRKVA